MRSRIDRRLLLGLSAVIGFPLLCSLVAVTPARGAATDVWPAQVPPFADEAALNQRLAGLRAAAATLPPELLPTIHFEEAFMRLLARSSENDWLPTIRIMAEAPGTDAVTAALRDLAKAWVARVEMRGIGAVLDNYYAKNVRYPGTLAEIEKDLPKDLKTDPWGEPWAYRPHAPAGFDKQVFQRYTLGPKRFPDLGTVKDATLNRKPFTPPPWKIAARPVGDGQALEFSNGSAVAGLLQAGGKLDPYTLLYIGNRWALMAAPDQLFTVTF